MSKITGDPELEKWAREQKPGNASVYINWDAINSLPEEFEAVMSRVAYDPAHLDASFANVGSKNKPSWYPNNDLLYKIAEAKGIGGDEVSLSQRLYDEVDINPMMCQPIDAPPNYQRRHIGHKISKRSHVIQEDGSLRHSSVCTSEYDAWTRCCEDWAKEDKRRAEGGTAQYGWKYDTPQKRHNHFLSELKFASAKAETKAECKTIRELAGLPTGYRSDQLQSGALIFVRIQRSQAVLKMETAARLEAIRTGASDGGRGATAALFGQGAALPPTQEALPEPESAGTTETDAAVLADFDSDVPPEPEPESINPYDGHPEHERAQMALAQYVAENLVDGAMVDMSNQMAEWLKRNKEKATEDPRWEQVLNQIRMIESNLGDGDRIDHGLVLY